MTFKSAGILSDQTLYLDHLIPVCELLDAPLFVTDEKVFAFGRKYYPPSFPIHYKTSQKLTPDFLVKNFNLILHPYYWAKQLTDHLFSEAQKAHRKKLRFLFVPHGNSDKGWHSDCMENYLHLDRALIYGIQMKEFLIAKHSLPEYFFMGNLRLQYYHKHRAFFDALIDKVVAPYIDLKRKTLLYAPTWTDHENSCSLFQFVESVITHILPSWNMIVKIHPMLWEKQHAHTENLIHSLQGKKNLLFLKEFPLVYPLFSISNAYLGDHSSLGYDFLSANKPLFFLNPTGRSIIDPSRLLHQCGVDVSLEKDLRKILAIQDDPFRKKRKKFYEHSFFPITAEEVRKNIVNYYKKLSQEGEGQIPSANH